MALSDERYVEILAGIEKIKEEKPYADADDATAALDWLGLAITDVQNAQRKAGADDVRQVGRLQQTAGELESLHSAVTTRMTVNKQDVPHRHGGPSTDALTPDD